MKLDIQQMSSEAHKLQEGKAQRTPQYISSTNITSNNLLIMNSRIYTAQLPQMEVHDTI